MFEHALTALENRKKQLLQEAEKAVAVIDEEIALLEKQSALSRENLGAETQHKAKIKAKELTIFGEKIWLAIKHVLDQHGAHSKETAIDADLLHKELKTGGALEKYTPGRSGRIHLICIGQHKHQSRYDKKTKKVWLVSEE